MSYEKTARLMSAFGQLGLEVGVHEDTKHKGQFVAALKLPSAAMKWVDVLEDIKFLGDEEHFSGYGETEEAALSGLRKRFRETARNDGVVVVRVTEPGRHLVIKSDGEDGVRNIGNYQLERTDEGTRVRAIELKR
ncbi:MAG TPA: hypothetical protein VL625_02785 [Patescibacteria group bacterium]|nr:hypothetical protein [Patescibacteria group bacterium]